MWPYLGRELPSLSKRRSSHSLISIRLDSRITRVQGRLLVQDILQKQEKYFLQKSKHWLASWKCVLTLRFMFVGQLVFGRTLMEMSLCESLQNVHKTVVVLCCDFIPNELEWLTRLMESLSNLVNNIYLRSLKCKQDRAFCLNSIRVCLWSDVLDALYSLLQILLALLFHLCHSSVNSLSYLLNYKLLQDNTLPDLSLHHP